MTIKELVDTIFQTRVIDAEQQQWIKRRLRKHQYTELDLEALDILAGAVNGGIVVVNPGV